MTETDVESIWVVLRSAGERSLPLALKALKSQTDRFTLIEEYPFMQAIKKTFEVGKERKANFLLALDADVILNHDALAKIAHVAEERLKATPELLTIDFPVFDKFRGFIYQGCRLFVNRYSAEIYRNILHLQHNPREPKPEWKIISDFAIKQELAIQKFDSIVGTHDYEQYYSHIFAKYYRLALREKQNISEIAFQIAKRRLLHGDDLDFAVAVYGLYEGENKEEAPYDARKYPKINEITSLQEKEPLRDN